MVLHSTKTQGAGGSRAGSTIPLLQERFKQLQRMRQKRKKMELSKLFPETRTMSLSNRYEPLVLRSMVHHEMMKTRPCSHDSFTLGLGLYTKQAEPIKPSENTELMEFRKLDLNKHEVDTSLHL
ncbi:hypothetical protein QVD17_05592 [Tagetes erecta]|uniref:Uncharacterized protein n=1 Tax=Tagetes erecta TaxID=13708 RepID=A0AAD8PBL8_TARER|nr:hypothetical protein QVD17_05592 [Tagetes erecta]